MAEHTRFPVRCRAIILHEGKLLVVKHRNGMPHYALPGGHLELGEGIEECLIREIEEELGTVPVVGRLLYVHTYADANKTQSVEFFFEVVNSADYTDILKLNGAHAHELENVLWIDPDTDMGLLPKRVADDFKSGVTLSDTTRCINAVT